MTDTTDLVDFVYYKMLNKEIRNQKFDNCNTNEIRLKGIKEVDGVKCDVILCVNYRTYMLRIESKYLIQDYHSYDNKIYYFNDIIKYDATEEYETKLKNTNKLHKNRTKIIKREDVSLCIDKLIIKLKKLKFNNFTGKFTEHNTNEKLYDAFKICNVTIEEGEECSVCYEKTLTKTTCKHSVCYRCIEKIPVTIDEEEDLNYIGCPICRHNVIYQKYEN